MFQPRGPHSVGVRDFALLDPDAGDIIDADKHVVGRLYYPCQHDAVLPWRLSAPVTWIHSLNYARGYACFCLFVCRSAFKPHQRWAAPLVKHLVESSLFVAGLLHWLPVHYNAPLKPLPSRMPVIIFSHGAACNRNSYSAICTEFASLGYLVAAVEHTDGSAGCVRLATGRSMFFDRMEMGPQLGDMCEHRVQECLTLLRLLQQLDAGRAAPGLQLSGAPTPSAAAALLAERLDLERLAVVGHSCGGATAALAAARHPEFKAAVALDPWWPLLPEGCAALQGWQTSTPLLVIGSEDWNTPSGPEGKLTCDGARQQRVFDAARARAAGCGGGAIHLVPAHSGHNNFSDLPLLVSQSRVLAALFRAIGVAQPRLSAQQLLRLTTSAMQHFLQRHLPPASPAQKRLRRQQDLSPGADAGASAAEGTGGKAGRVQAVAAVVMARLNSWGYVWDSASDLVAGPGAGHLRGTCGAPAVARAHSLEEGAGSVAGGRAHSRQHSSSSSSEGSSESSDDSESTCSSEDGAGSGGCGDVEAQRDAGFCGSPSGRGGWACGGGLRSARQRSGGQGSLVPGRLKGDGGGAVRAAARVAEEDLEVYADMYGSHAVILKAYA